MADARSPFGRWLPYTPVVPLASTLVFLIVFGAYSTTIRMGDFAEVAIRTTGPTVNLGELGDRSVWAAVSAAWMLTMVWTCAKAVVVVAVNTERERTAIRIGIWMVFAAAASGMWLTFMSTDSFAAPVQFVGRMMLGAARVNVRPLIVAVHGLACVCASLLMFEASAIAYVP